jgi:hypothetical protein
VHSPKGANFDSRFVSREGAKNAKARRTRRREEREGAKNAKEKACDGFSTPSLEEGS